MKCATQQFSLDFFLSEITLQFFTHPSILVKRELWHISVELKFMQYLVGEVAAWKLRD